MRSGHGDDAVEVGGNVFIENVYGTPCLQGRLTRFFSRPSHNGGFLPPRGGHSERAGPGFRLAARQFATARMSGTGGCLPCSGAGGSPLHICLDSGGWQAIVVPFRGQLAQMDRALASGAKGHRFESCIAHHATRRGVFGYTGNAPFLRGVPAPGDTPHPFPRRPSLRRPLVLVVFQKK